MIVGAGFILYFILFYFVLFYLTMVISLLRAVTYY